MFQVFILLIIISNTHCLRCKDIQEVTDINKVNIYEMQSLSPQDVIECISHLGKNKLSLSLADFIWNSIIEFYHGIPNIPDDILMMLHWVTIAIEPEEYENMTLSTLDVITNFGSDYDLSDNQLSAIADRVRWDFGSKQPEDYSYYDLTALNQILCAFNKSEIERIQPKAYKEVSLVIGKLKNCNFDVLQGFATLAVDEKAFGSPDKWTNSTIYSLGVVATHLPEDIAVKIKKKFGSDILKKASKTDKSSAPQQI